MEIKQVRESAQTSVSQPDRKSRDDREGQMEAAGHSGVSPSTDSPLPSDDAPTEERSISQLQGATKQRQEQASPSRWLCRDVMRENPVCCVLSDPIDVAAQLMVTEDVGALPVVKDLRTNELIGIITDRDLTIKVVAEGRDPKGTIVEEVMTHEPITCHPEDDGLQALESMAEYQVSHVPVVDNNGYLIGMITQADIATRIAEPEKMAQVIEGILQSVLRGERLIGTRH